MSFMMHMMQQQSWQIANAAGGQFPASQMDMPNPSNLSMGYEGGGTTNLLRTPTSTTQAASAPPPAQPSSGLPPSGNPFRPARAATPPPAQPPSGLPRSGNPFRPAPSAVPADDVPLVLDVESPDDEPPCDRHHEGAPVPVVARGSVASQMATVVIMCLSCYRVIVYFFHSVIQKWVFL